MKSIEGVCDVVTFGPSSARVLVEVPHGATRADDYRAVATRMVSKLPDELDHFFNVNTDIGAPEGAYALGEMLSASGIGTLVVRCLVPRTFVDTNRVIDLAASARVVAGLTPGVPGYITHADDITWLVERHAAYHELVARAYQQVCGDAGGLAVQLHSYAPRSVGVDATDANIVAALHAAYEPGVYSTWPVRPAVDIIAATEDGSFNCSPELVAAVRAAYADIGVIAGENATYYMHPITMGLAYAKAYPDRVLCVEIARDLLAERFIPFGRSVIDGAKVAKMVAPLATVLRDRLS